jgi:hypothetical protein
LNILPRVQHGRVPQPEPYNVIEENDIIHDMERQKAFLGWKCTLLPEEVEYAEQDLVLGSHLERWRSQPNGTATLRIAPWNSGSRFIMEMFIEGLGEGMFETINVEPVGKIEIVEREY